MTTNRSIFSQLLDYAPRRDFRRCVSKHRGNHNVRSFACWDQFLCMAFAQLTHRDSLRDVEICLRGMREKLYRLGLRGNISRSTLADANENRSSQIFADFCGILIKRAQYLYREEKFLSELASLVYLLDSSWIRLCLSLCPWARFGKDAAYIKIHTLLDLRGSIPSFIAISPGNINDSLIIDRLQIMPGAFYIMDKGYFDLPRLSVIKDGCAYFVIRNKIHVRVERLSSARVDKACGLRADQVVKFKGKFARKSYTDKIRLVVYRDVEARKTYRFLTNNFTLPAITICALYKQRWQIELFFRWIKQHLKIKKFYGTSKNATETQIWIAVSVYLLVAILKKELKLKTPLYQILHILSVSLFEEIPILEALSRNIPTKSNKHSPNQLDLF